ncbi:GtrA family protein [Cohnella fermenti]|uniref:GtrA family protein n=1 Tax=Cohnella fermenti TaxID=2565925 RepID=A0A4S4C486_9BACL|nr:GtrA family protein [Cohnella fermenti]THF82586.1 GtrA family protein [Cohnella fermenti]
MTSGSRGKINQLAKFATVGVMNTAVDLVVFSALVYGLGAASALAQTISYLCGFLNSYVWNRSWTFRTGKRASAGELLRFGIVNAVSFGVSMAVLLGMEKGLGFSPLAAKLVSIVASLAANYAGSKLWVFREPQRKQEEA